MTPAAPEVVEALMSGWENTKKKPADGVLGPLQERDPELSYPGDPDYFMACHKASVTPHIGTLLEAFNFCDKKKDHYIDDRKMFAFVATMIPITSKQRYKLMHNIIDNKLAEVWKVLDTDGNTKVSFPEFVDWADEWGVALPIGIPGMHAHDLAFPPTWRGSKDDKKWNQRDPVTDPAVLADLQTMFTVSYKTAWTRDRRKHVGDDRIPVSFEVISAKHCENYRDWRGYYIKRHQIEQHCTKFPSMKRHLALTGNAQEAYRRHGINSEINEWLLYHGTSPDAAEKIAGGDFSMKMAGSATGTLYGRGSYFAESITKADEYAKQDADGNCWMLVVRAVGGHVLYTDEETPDADKLQKQVLDDHYDSIIGDREKCKGTYKEYVLFDADQIYNEYIVLYKRHYDKK